MSSAQIFVISTTANHTHPNFSNFQEVSLDHLRGGARLKIVWEVKVSFILYIKNQIYVNFLHIAIPCPPSEGEMRLKVVQNKRCLFP